jgi:hydroxymethylbilane synthase
LQRDCEIVLIKTSGDRFVENPLESLGQKGVFIKELEDALLDDRIDLAVHSMKDVPTEIPRGLVFPAIAWRNDVRDCLISRCGRGMQDLPPHSRIGTGSLRRQAQIRNLRPDIEIEGLRGNLDTRLRKLEQGNLDGILLAKAGLDRLKLGHRISEVFEPDTFLPAVGQGALGIEARAEDAEIVEVLGLLNDVETRAAITAERALLRELEGGCQVPIGAFARMDQGQLVLDAGVFALDGSSAVRDRIVCNPEAPEEAGRLLGKQLLATGADRILLVARRRSRAV